MNIEEIRNYCMSKNGVTEGFLFNDTALVFKVSGKMFALLDLSDEKRGISLKCEPGLAEDLRERYPYIAPAWHFNKKHWNCIDLKSEPDQALLKEMIDHSYQVTVSKLPVRDREKLLPNVNNVGNN